MMMMVVVVMDCFVPPLISSPTSSCAMELVDGLVGWLISFVFLNEILSSVVLVSLCHVGLRALGCWCLFDASGATVRKHLLLFLQVGVKE